VSLRTPFENVSNELNLRKEIESFMMGGNGETPKASKFVLRIMRRNADESLVPCQCLSTMTKEPDQEHQCPYCLGEGYLWDEPAIVSGYKMPAEAKSRLQAQKVALQGGQIDVFNKVFFLLYNQPITKADKVVELKLDSDGRPSIPYRRNLIHRIESLIDYRSDFGRTEFWAVYVNENPSVRISKRS
jgi:hypothetical protein